MSTNEKSRPISVVRVFRWGLFRDFHSSHKLISLRSLLMVRIGRSFPLPLFSPLATQGPRQYSIKHPMTSSVNLFVYGSLMFPSVLHALLGRTPRTHSGINHGIVRACVMELKFSVPATLRDFHRFAIKERAYPGIFPKQGGSVLVRTLQIKPFVFNTLTGLKGIDAC